MNSHIKQKIRTSVILICSFILICPSASVKADEITDLENKTSTLSGQLSGINQEMVRISDEISSVNSQIEIIQSEILRTRDSLSDAQADESQRYEDMKSRIKYMYEVGNVSLLEMLFSADSMSDFLNKAEFIENISSYDRDMLLQLQSVREGILEQEQVLLAQQDSLKDLQAQLQTRQTDLKATAEATSTDLSTFTAQLTMLREEEARKAEEARREKDKPVSQPVVSTPDADTDDFSDDKGSNSSTVVNGSAANVSAGELDIFAAILECEAMQDHDSLLAVATVIMNRLNSSIFPNTIKDVVYAQGQFEPVWTGRLDSVLSRGASDLSYQVAQEALGGARLASVADCYYFLYAGATNRAGVNVGNNLFFQSW